MQILFLLVAKIQNSFNKKDFSIWQSFCCISDGVENKRSGELLGLRCILLFAVYVIESNKLKDMTKEKNEGFASDNEDLNNENLTNNQSENEETTQTSDNVAESEEATLEEKYKELNNSYLRLHAEFDNFRKRTVKEKADLIKTGTERVFADLLPILDDFERAIENIANAGDMNAVKEGIGLIHNKFVSFLNKSGVKEIETIGQPFDVDKHEALTTIPAQDESQKDTIVDCVQKGYVLGDRVIRYPKVIVAK